MTNRPSCRARALSFGTVIVANLGLIIEGRSRELWLGAVLRKPNRPMWIVFTIVVPALFLVLFTPGVIGLFTFEQMPPIGIPIFIGLGLASTLWFELYKLFYTCYIKNQSRKTALQRAATVQPVELAPVPEAIIVECDSS